MVAITFTGHWTGAKTIPEQKVIVFRKIRCGSKVTTIRKKARCRPGDKLQLYWHMRQKDCEKILDTECIKVQQIIIHTKKAIITDPDMGRREITDRFVLDQLALADGFIDYQSMVAYFEPDIIYDRISWQPPINVSSSAHQRIFIGGDTKR